MSYRIRPPPTLPGQFPHTSLRAQLEHVLRNDLLVRNPTEVGIHRFWGGLELVRVIQQLPCFLVGNFAIKREAEDHLDFDFWFCDRGCDALHEVNHSIHFAFGIEDEPADRGIIPEITSV